MAIFLLPILMLFTLFAYLVAFFICFMFFEKQDKPNFVQVKKAFSSSILLTFQFALIEFTAIAIFGDKYSSAAPIYLVLDCVGVAVVSFSGFFYFLIRDIPAWCQWNTWWK
jgi:hypothetical protein